jgi:tetratricopeptide (TPR) repeat protein
MSEQTPKKSFFISYTGADIERAKWVTKTLEDNGYTAIIQARDFLVGTHFPQNMDEALKNTEAVLTIVSAKYLSSDYCRSEWLTAYRQDRTGGRRYIIPVRVEEVVPEGMLARNIYIDIFGEMDEEERKKKLLLGMKERLPKLKEGEESDEEQTENFWKNEKTGKSLPYCRNGYFTGREKTLADLQGALLSKDAAHPIQVIAGLGGVGKTEIALEFCYRNLSRFHTVWWMPAEDTIGLDTAYKKLGDAKGILSGDEKDADEIRETVRSWLENNPGYLLIYDNVENTKALSPYLPREIPGSIIITSRDVKIAAGLEQEHNTVNIDVFDAPDAALFLVKRARKADSAGAEELAQRLGLLSLALEHAAAYILANNISFADYLALLEKSGLEVFNASEDKNRRYLRTVNSTWRISIAKIKNQSAEQMLYLCAYLASEGIYLKLFEYEQNPSPLKEDMRNALNRNAIIREMTRYSLVSESNSVGEKLYSMHRLLQETLRNSLEGDNSYITHCVDIFDNNFDFAWDELESLASFAKNLPHAVAVSDYGSAVFVNDKRKLDQIGRIYMITGEGLQHEGQYDRALSQYKKALAIRTKLFGEKHIETADIYDAMGEAYREKGARQESLDSLKTALDIKRNEYGTEDSAVAKTYHGLGETFQSNNSFIGRKKALEWYAKALAILEKLSEDTSKGNVYNSIALVYADQRKHAKALEFYLKALAIDEKKYGPDHHALAPLYNNISLAYSARKKAQLALDYAQRSFAITQKVYGPDHPDMATAYNTLANIYHKLKSYDKALEYYQKALEIDEKVFGPNSAHTAISYNNMGTVCNSLKKHDEAVIWYQKSLDIMIAVYGERSMPAGHRYGNIGIAYRDKGDYKKAADYFFLAAAIFLKEAGEWRLETSFAFSRIKEVVPKIPDSKSRETAAYYIKTAELYLQYMRKKALPWLKLALAVMRNDQTHEAAVMYRFMGDVWTEYSSTFFTEMYTVITKSTRETGSHRKAMRCYEKSRVIFEKLGESGTPAYADLCYSLGLFHKTLVYSGRSPEAEAAFRQALEIREKTLGQDHIDTARACVMVSRELHSAEERLNYLLKALPVYEKVLGIGDTDTAKLLYDIGYDYHLELRSFDGTDTERGNIAEKAAEYYIRSLRSYHAYLNGMSAMDFVERSFSEKKVDDIEDKLFTVYKSLCRYVWKTGEGGSEQYHEWLDKQLEI